MNVWMKLLIQLANYWTSSFIQMVFAFITKKKPITEHGLHQQIPNIIIKLMQQVDMKISHQ